MARARNIKPGFFTNEVLALLPHQTQLFFIGLWTLADREGRLEDRPLRIKAALFPYGQADVDSMLNQLQVNEFVFRYEIAGHKYIEVANFLKHQAPHYKEKKSVIPPSTSLDTEAGLVQAPDVHRTGRADSLIPDSLIPDSLSTETQERDFSGEVFEIAKVHPRIAHRKNGPSRIEQEVIAEAIARDGRDLVLVGTQNLAEMVEQWPITERKFIPDPVKFYQHEDYKLDPETWNKSKPSAIEGREGINTNRPAEQPESPADPNCESCRGRGCRPWIAHPGKFIRCECTYAVKVLAAGAKP